MRTPTSLLSLGLGLTLATLAAGCDPGSVDDGGGGNGGGVGTDDRITCMAALNIAGTFTASTPKPDTISGCWPIGTWTFRVTVADHDCPSAPEPLAEYVMRVDRNTASEDPDFSWLYSFVTDPAATTRMKVSSGGGGLCEGGLVIYSADGKTIWNLHPALQADGSLNGVGDYEVHTTNQVPQTDE